jgi:hypothetical protein
MIALTKSYQRNERIVSTLISGFERALAPEVADRVHAPGGMVHEEHAECATPQESSQPTTKPPSSDQPDCEWCHKIAHHYNKSEAAVYRHHHGIIQQIRDIALPRCPLVGKQPAEVGMDKASYPATPVTDMRAMWIARLIGVNMVLAMVRHPVWD